MKELIAVIGLGYVGLPLAVEFGKKRRVIGFDISHARISELEKGIDKTLEITGEELSAAAHLSFSLNIDDLKYSRDRNKILLVYIIFLYNRQI
jgi:UDP-N-acetyl-D-galactosamine dehydrogenase